MGILENEGIWIEGGDSTTQSEFSFGRNVIVKDGNRDRRKAEK